MTALKRDWPAAEPHVATHDIFYDIFKEESCLRKGDDQTYSRYLEFRCGSSVFFSFQKHNIQFNMSSLPRGRTQMLSKSVAAPLVEPDLTYSKLKGLSDEVLMSHIEAGDGDALAVVFDRYHRLVFN